tara:strand:- start:1080 stop:1274 length:195 start_codon:yes stop_codon:yes gene_type:complete
MWIGSRRIVEENPDFTPEVDIALREYRGPGFYRSTGERVAPESKDVYSYIENEQDFEMMFHATR